MPYIITTYAESHEITVLEEISRVAVATLDEARAEIQTDLCDRHNATGPDDPAIITTLDLSESGGTVGPLPDGTVIEVRPVSWNWIVGVAEDIGIDTDDVYADGGDAAIMAAFNAAQ